MAASLIHPRVPMTLPRYASQSLATTVFAKLAIIKLQASEEHSNIAPRSLLADRPIAY